MAIPALVIDARWLPAERNGQCTYCGDTVPLTYKDRQKAAEAAAEAAQQEHGAGATEDAATAAARAFKVRAPNRVASLRGTLVMGSCKRCACHALAVAAVCTPHLCTAALLVLDPRL